jgi:hypothetical protein
MPTRIDFLNHLKPTHLQVFKALFSNKVKEKRYQNHSLENDNNLLSLRFTLTHRMTTGTQRP